MRKKAIKDIEDGAVLMRAGLAYAAFLKTA